MPVLESFRANSKLAALIFIFLVSFSLYGLYCINTVTEVKINGPFYNRIIQSKDVIADVLPPPAYLIEANLVAYQMIHAGSEDALDALETRFLQLKAAYEASHNRWTGNLAEDALKQALVVESYRPAMRMLDAMQSAYIPALRAGDREQADSVLERSVQPEYSAHRLAIDKVVALAVKRNKEDEARAAIAVQSRTYGQIGLGAFLFFALSIVSAFVMNRAESLSGRESAPGSGGQDSGHAGRTGPSSAPAPKERESA